MKNLIKNVILILIPFSKQYLDFRKSGQKSSYFTFFKFKTGISKIPFPIEKGCQVAHYKRVKMGINCLVTRPGNYIQAVGGVEIGDYVQFGPNVGILSTNHDLYDQRKYNHKKVIIGDYSWVGMNSVVLPGVELGKRTIVAAGSVVTKSFPEGYCVIGGNPAKKIKELDPEEFIPWKGEVEYYGFIPKNKKLKE